MLKVSDAFNSAFAAPDRELRARVTIGKTVYDSDDLTSINYDSGAMTGEQFSIGSTYMNSTKINFSHLVEGLKQLDEVLVEFGVLKPDGTVEYVKMGTFIVDDKIQMDRNNNTTTIECMDRMTMLGGTYVSKLTYPARIKDVAIEVANMAGVKVNETSFARLSENKINQPTGYTYRDAIGLITQFQMGFALFDRDGLLDIRTLQDNSFKIDPNQYFLKGLVKNETFFKLNGISCTVVTTSKDENGNETSKTTVLQSGSSSGAQIKLANNVMTQDVLDRMYEALKFTNYYPFSLNWNGNPAVEAGDWLTVEDLQGNEFKVPNMSYTLTYNGGLTATSKADTSVSSPATYSYGGSMSNIVNEIGGREGAEGNHIYEGTEDQKPLFPKEGDLWYKHVGPDTEEWIYKDGKWEFLTSTKTANDAADAADKASKEAEEAKKQANDAVNQANQAVEDAGFANDTADQAKSDAAAAGQQAKDALTSAGTAAADAVTAKNDAATALTGAKKALTDSSSAMADSAQARKDSAAAIKDAADSLTSAKDAISKVGSLTTSVTSQFTTVDNELKSKVNQTDYDKLKGTVTSQQTEISQNTSGIKLKADKSYADTINDSVVKNTSNVGLLNDQIALTVSKTELNNTLSSYATQTWTQSQIKSTADQINLSVTKVQTNLDNLNVQDRNLYLGTKTMHGWTKRGNANLVTLDGEYVTDVGGDWAALWNPVHIEKGKKYKWSIDYKGIVNAPFILELYVSPINGVATTGVVIARDLKTDWTRAYGEFTSTFTGDAMIRAEVDNGDWTVLKHVYTRHIKLSSSDKDTGWSEAPEDSITDVEFSGLQLTVNGIQGTVQNKADQSQVTQLSNQISLKADTTALNDLKGTVDKQGSEIMLNTNSIKLKADQSSVNTLKGTVDKQGSAIDVNTKAIALKASQSTVDTLTGRVSTAEGKITVQADQIAQTVSKTELTSKLNGYATQTWSQGQISAAKNEITASVETVKQTVNNMVIGGRNYFSVSGFIANKYTNDGTIDFYDLKLLPNTKYIVSTNKTVNNLGYADIFAGRKGLVPSTPSNGVTAGQSQIILTDTTGVLTIAARSYSIADGKDKIQVELGAVATTWQPAPEDLATVDWAKSQLAVTDGKITASVSSLKSDITSATNALNNNITTATAGMATQTWTQGQINTTADNINLSVSKVQTDLGGTKTQFAALEVKVNGIQTTVSGKADQSQVTQLAGQITSVVTNVEQIGNEGRNYFHNSNFARDLDSWGIDKAGSTNPSIVRSGYYKLGYKIGLHMFGTSNVPYNGFWQQTSMYGAAGDNVVLSFIAAQDGNYDSMLHIGLTFYKDSQNVGSTAFDMQTKNFNNSSGSRENHVFKAPAEFNKVSVRLAPTANIPINVWLTNLKLESNALTPYTEAPEDRATQSQITQLTNDINLRVQKGDVVNQINISPEGILIDGQKVHITGQTTIDNAVIKDAMIADIKADKITAGTLNAANVNVINLNANNITTGTIRGANLSMNLNTGEILFQKGSIRSTNGNLNINIDDGSMSLTNSQGEGAYFIDGKIAMTKNDIWTNGAIHYGQLTFGNNIFGNALGSVSGVLLEGAGGVIVGNKEFNPLTLFGPGKTYPSGGGIAANNSFATVASNGWASIEGGTSYAVPFSTNNPSIVAGISGKYSAPGAWMPTSDKGAASFVKGKLVGLYAEDGGFSMDHGTTADLAAAVDGRSGYILSAATYARTYASGAQMMVTENGVFGRISSASKYKLAIGEISTLNDEAHQFLSVKPKQWFDKSESEALADIMTTGNTDYVDDAKVLPHNGFIAEDLYTAGLDSYVIRGNDGSIESIQYDRLPVLHHELIRELFNRLDAAEMEIYKLKQEVLNNAS
ncbi:gp58-like family protein [Latilactobacillus sakei]|uniref:gp58-like family protein n=1 Tax=Latilactobacillus sakei TaxID=1599 RepID=UPI0034A1CEBD